MTLKEMSDTMDVVLNSFSDGGVELDEYEKSVFLTKAQEVFIEELYTDGAETYEETERLRRSLANLNTEMEYNPINDTQFKPISRKNSKFFQLDDDVLYITYEAVRTNSDSCLENIEIEVVPVRQDWFHRQVNNPFRGATKNRALRIDKSDNVIEIVSPLSNITYYVRYIRRPQPIVLVNLPDGLRVGNTTQRSECELDPMLHKKIIDRAVVMALTSKNALQKQNTNV